MNYEDGLYWFMLQPIVVIVSVGVATSVAVMVSVLLILRRWGEYN